MARATHQGTVVAESDETVVVEGNHYFPPAALVRETLTPSTTTTTCPWKGVASYFDVVTPDGTVADGAWTYADPKPEAEAIRDHVAFYVSRGIVVEA